MKAKVIKGCIRAKHGLFDLQLDGVSGVEWGVVYKTVLILDQNMTPKVTKGATMALWQCAIAVQASDSEGSTVVSASVNREDLHVSKSAD